MKQIALVLVAMLSLTGCTLVHYSSGDRSLLVMDIHPGGESIDFSGQLEGIGEAELNREQGSSENVITGTVDSLTGIPGL